MEAPLPNCTIMNYQLVLIRISQEGIFFGILLRYPATTQNHQLHLDGQEALSQICFFSLEKHSKEPSYQTKKTEGFLKKSD